MELSEEQVEALHEKAEAGDVDAQYELGWRYAIGMGLHTDDAEGLRWIQCAADQGHPLAQNNLGARYVAGDGVGRDLVTAYLWFHRASLQGDRKASKNRDSIVRQMTEAEFLEAKGRAGVN